MRTECKEPGRRASAKSWNEEPGCRRRVGAKSLGVEPGKEPGKEPGQRAGAKSLGEELGKRAGVKIRVKSWGNDPNKYCKVKLVCLGTL